MAPSITGIGGSICPPASGGAPPAMELRQQDASIRASLAREAAAAGQHANVFVEYTYATGADGKQYVTGGRVTVSEKVTRDGESAYAPSFGRSGRESLEALGLAATQPRLSPLEMAALYAEEQGNEKEVLAKLRGADAGVRAHEAQHFRAAGGLAVGTPEYEYQQGPDGQYYVVGGHVDVSTSRTADPEKAARDAHAFALAATAPGDASSQDLAAARGAFSKATAAFKAASAAVSDYLGLSPRHTLDIHA